MPVKPAVEIADEEIGVAALECSSKRPPLSFSRRTGWTDIDIRDQAVQGLGNPWIGLVGNGRVDGTIARKHLDRPGQETEEAPITIMYRGDQGWRRILWKSCMHEYLGAHLPRFLGTRSFRILRVSLGMVFTTVSATCLLRHARRRNRNNQAEPDPIQTPGPILACMVQYLYGFME
jgi:hypothetical protein